MTLHAAKGLEFPLVILAGMEEGLFPSSRTLMEPDAIEEERRLCYVGMTRAMDTLILSRAVYRRRYGTDLPEASVPSRFLDEVPPQLVDELGGSRRRASSAGSAGFSSASGFSSSASHSRTRVSAPHSKGPHYSYEDEDQSATWDPARVQVKAPTVLQNYNSIDNIAEFFASRGKKFSVPKLAPEEPRGRRGFRPGQKVQASQIWRRDCVSTRRRWGRGQDYGTIPSLRFEETGGEVRAAGTGLGLPRRTLKYCGPITLRFCGTLREFSRDVSAAVGRRDLRQKLECPGVA